MTSDMNLPETDLMKQEKIVFVFEDSDDNRLLMRHFMKKKPIQIHEFVNGRISLEQIDQLKPDVMLVDWRMPEVSGADLLEFLESHRPELLSRVIVLSGSSEEVEVQEWSSKILRVMPKPCPWPELLQLIDEV